MQLLLLLLMLLALLSLQSLRCRCLIPDACVHNVTLGNGICCPAPKGSAEVCGGRMRGQCMQLQVYKNPELKIKNFLKPGTLRDDRLNWPLTFVRVGCVCEPRFWGPDCSECFFGWEGTNCNRRALRVRRNIFSFSAKEKKRYLHLLQEFRAVDSGYSVLEEKYPNRSDPLRHPVFLKANPLYWLVFVHSYTSRPTVAATAAQCKKLGSMNLNHASAGFMTWHRYFTLLIERELWKLAVRHYNWTDFALPYWDWVDAKWCEVCTNDLAGEPLPCINNHTQLIHPNSPISTWRSYCPDTEALANDCVGCHAKHGNGSEFPLLHRSWNGAPYPSSLEVQQVLLKPVYYWPSEYGHWRLRCSFARAVEGSCKTHSDNMHNTVHDMFSGMFSGQSSPNDPVFYFHHSQMERLMQAWHTRFQPHPHEMARLFTLPGHSASNNLVGFYPPITHEQLMVDGRSLGFTYDSMQFGDVTRRRFKRLGQLPSPKQVHLQPCTIPEDDKK